MFRVHGSRVALPVPGGRLGDPPKWDVSVPVGNLWGCLLRDPADSHRLRNQSIAFHEPEAKL